jgi:ABC-type dipeptide/oligopeptide/nickel transport system permease subunit
VLGFRLSAATMRMTRSTVLEVLREDYVRTAWAKGLAGRVPRSADQVPLTRPCRRSPLGAASAALIVVLVLTACFADVLAPYDPLAAHPEIRLSAPTWDHPFGTDDIGRDVLSRVIHGARISLWVGFLAVGIGTVVGMIIGLLCGYCEGRVDLVFHRLMDAIQAIPGLVLALAIVSVLRPNTTNAMLAIAMGIIPGNSRIVRGAVLAAKQRF